MEKIKRMACSRSGVLFLLVLLLMLAGCGDKPAPQFDFEKNAISIDYLADKQLNQYNEMPHSVVLAIYQLSDVNAFNSRAAYRDGLVELLSAKSFDASVTAVTKKYVEPGSSGVISMDRAAHTKYLGIVAGFYSLLPEKASLLTDVTYETGRHGLLLTKKTTINPLQVKVFLGKDGIRLAEDKSDS